MEKKITPRDALNRNKEQQEITFSLFFFFYGTKYFVFEQVVKYKTNVEISSVEMIWLVTVELFVDKTNNVRLIVLIIIIFIYITVLLKRFRLKKFRFGI